jgi:hypothetical protein
MDTYLNDAPLILLTLYGANLIKGNMPIAWQWCDRGAKDYPRDLRFTECRLTLLAEDAARNPDPALAWGLVAKADAVDPPEHARASGRGYLPIYREMMAAAVSARAGDKDKARFAEADAVKKAGTDKDLNLDLLYERAYVHLLLGEKGEAIKLLSEYLRARPSLSGLVARHARWRLLWTDSSFIRLIHKGAPISE